MRSKVNLLKVLSYRCCEQIRFVTTENPSWVQLHGANGSPYTKKVASALRYKRIPFTFHHLMPGDFQGDWEEKGFGHIKPKVIPVIKYADQTSQNDSTFILEKLDKLYPKRPITSSDPLTAFYALLLEDMYDEWGTKVMFGMRWLKEVDQKWSARYLMYDGSLGKGVPLSQMSQFGDQFGARQVSRMKIVGCDNTDMVTRSLAALVSPLENHLQAGSMFMLGGAPTIADFALYGQLSQIVIDRTGDEILRDQYPAVWAWIKCFEDLSGVDGDVHCDNKQFLSEMMTFAKEVYLPFLGANSRAVEQGLADTEVTLWQDSHHPIRHSQPSFKYQHKCHLRIKQSLEELPEGVRETLKILKDT